MSANSRFGAAVISLPDVLLTVRAQCILGTSGAFICNIDELPVRVGRLTTPEAFNALYTMANNVYVLHR